MPASTEGDPPAADVPADTTPCLRTPGTAGAGDCRAEHEQWQRRLRLQRRLHDGASLRISALVPQLGVVRNRVPEARPDLDASIEELQDQLHTVLQELREIARVIYPPLLDLAGLAPALKEFADRVPVPVRVEVAEERLGAAVEGAAYFAVTGCLGDLRPGGPPVDVVARRAGAELVVTLTGVPPRLAVGVLDQVHGLGGQVRTSGDPEDGTIEARIPCA
ncbi:histidine kinase [Geodermatophilus sabuli]|uniref:Histidine kinase n=1 Tax=Geodermatophilus sabuli TaxID=1564158 RepID=A0A285EEU3_9ACTN|nr:histidine kinase [Geodermatophilus sabuli]MBB3086218.1 hypothetical protein [Geodermatophilus sabuli]SNX97565.1 Histidine kinase [Geodermatophilus sabuli]